MTKVLQHWQYAHDLSGDDGTLVNFQSDQVWQRYQWLDVKYSRIRYVTVFEDKFLDCTGIPEAFKGQLLTPIESDSPHS